MSDERTFGAIGEPQGADPPIRLGAEAASQAKAAVRWQLLLVWFMRIVALLWLVQGFSHWHSILAPSPSALQSLPPLSASALAGFAVLDLLAAVGLWLVTPWGGVLWILTVAAQMAAIVFLPGFFASGRLILAIDAALVVGYFVITFQAGREELNRPQ
jgi:hypothetical protein